MKELTVEIVSFPISPAFLAPLTNLADIFSRTFSYSIAYRPLILKLNQTNILTLNQGSLDILN